MRMTEVFRRDFLVSVRPLYAEKILAGEKTVELRRRFVEEPDPGAIAMIYSTSPVQALMGYVAIKMVRRLPIKVLWREYGAAACIDREDFELYFNGVDDGYAILLRDVKRFRCSIDAADLRQRFGFVPPQSFMYLPEEYYPLLDYDHLQTSNRHECFYRSRGPETG
jgi:predicted transcriptional regulator